MTAWRAGALSTATATVATPTAAGVAATVALGTFGLANACQHFSACGLSGGHHHIAARRFACTTPNGLAAHGNRLGLFTGFGHEAFDDLNRNVLLCVALNGLHETFFVQAHQVDGSAIGAGATGAANAVNVVFTHIGNLVVHHVRQVVNVNAARGDVSGHQGADIATFEAAQRLGAGSLALVAVQGHGLNAVFGQKFSHIVGTKLGAGKHQHLAPVVFLDDVCEQGFFLATAYGVNQLGDALHRGVARGDLDALRIFQQSGGQIADLVTEGGREQQALFFPGHDSQDLFHVMDKAHVQHAVGFVQYQHLHLAQIQHALLQQVQQTTGRGHQNVHTFFDAADLGVHAHAAKNDGGAQFQVLAVGLHRLFHLGRQLAGGGEDQSPDAEAAEFVLGSRALAEFVQHGQHEGRGFAGAGLSAAEQVMPFQHRRNSLRLNGRGGFITLLEHGFDDGRSQV